MRSLSPDEQALWARVTETIRPLSRARVKSPEPASQTPTPVARKPVPAKPLASPPKAPRGMGTTLDGSWDRKLGTGRVQPDRTLDLHGMTLDHAWSAIDRLLEQAIANGDRVLLLITGHAPRGAPPIQRGRIRAAVHDWLNASRHARHIAAVRNAHPRHGGGGSLYIILRRG